MLTVAMWILTGCLLLFGLVAVSGNWIFIIRYFLYNTHESMIPLIGGICLALATITCPMSFLNWWWFLVALIIDPSISFNAAWAIIYVFKSVGLAILGGQAEREE